LEESTLKVHIIDQTPPDQAYTFLPPNP